MGDMHLLGDDIEARLTEKIKEPVMGRWRHSLARRAAACSE